MPPRVRRGRFHRVISCVLCALGWAPLAAAQSPVQVPAGCGSEAEFRGELERLTGSQPPAGVPTSLRIEPLAARGPGYELRLVLGDELRVLRDAECRVLFRSAIVIAAAASRGDVSVAPATAPETVAPAPVAPAPVAPAPVAPASAVPAPGATSPAAGAPGAPSAAPVPGVVPAPRRLLPRSALTPRERQNARLARARYARAAARSDTSASRSSPRGTLSSRARSARLGSAPAAAAASSPGVEASRAAVLEAAPEGLHYGIDLSLGLSGGVLPELGAVLGVGARVELSRWGAAFAFRYWPQRSGEREGRGVDVSALGGRVAALMRVAPTLNVIAGLELARLEGEGSAGVSGRSSAAAWQLAPTLGLNLIPYDIGYLRIELGVAGRLSVLRPRFVVTGFGDLYRVPALGADAIIRGVWLFR